MSTDKISSRNILHDKRMNFISIKAWQLLSVSENSSKGQVEEGAMLSLLRYSATMVKNREMKNWKNHWDDSWKDCRQFDKDNCKRFSSGSFMNDVWFKLGFKLSQISRSKIN